MLPLRALLFSAAVLTLCALSGCRDAQITTYRTPKENAPPTPAAATPASSSSTTPATSSSATMAATAVPTAGGADLKWTAPAHWESKPASSMRKATYLIPGDGGATAELAVTAFPGDVGGEAANLTRWRGQLQLPEIPAAELAAAVTRIESGGLKIAIADYVNETATPPQRLLGAIVPVGDATWFFKLTGPPALIAREKTAFLDFLKTIKAPAP